MSELVQTAPQVHLMFNGRTEDIDVNLLDVGTGSTDSDIRAAVARHLEVPLAKLLAFRVEKNHETGDINMRPEAEFGCN